MTIEVFTPRWKEQLSRLFVGRGGRGGPLTVLDDVMPTAPLVDAAEAELHRTRAEDLWSVAHRVAAVALNQPVFYLDNGPNTGRLVVVEGIRVGDNSVAGRVALRPAIGFTGGTTSIWKGDFRANYGGTQSFCPLVNIAQVGSGTYAWAPGQPEYAGAYLPAQSMMIDLITPVRALVLPPNTGFLLYHEGVNSNLAVEVYGYTRPVENLELA
jgi:hypothetical protein